MSVIDTVEALPTTGLTVSALEALDYIVPGEWSNVTSFDAIIAEVCGEGASPKLIAQVRHTAKVLEMQDPARFQQAVQIYNLVDDVDKAAAAVAAAGKVTDLFGGLDFLKKFTPKPETTQAVDAGLKLVAELLAFGRLNGMPSTDPDGLARFVGALADYGRYDLIRIAAWVVFDGVIPLGPNFVQAITGTWRGLATDALNSNGAFKNLAAQLPGDSIEDKQGFIVKTLDTTGEWVNRFVSEKGITQEGVMHRMQEVMGVAEGGMDYVAAAIDASTSYYAHTGTQTVARSLARQAHDQLRDKVWQDYLKSLA